MISIVEPKNSAAISERKCSNGFAYKLKWDFHEVFLLLLFEEGETQVDFLLFVSFCVSASTIVADGHILSYSKRMSDKNNNNHNMALKQCFVLRDDIHEKTHQFFFSLSFFFFFLFSHCFRHCGVVCCHLLAQITLGSFVTFQWMRFFGRE